MTVGLHQLAPGDTVELKGPLGSFVWQGSGTALWKNVPRKVTEMGLVCGGSGARPSLPPLPPNESSDRMGFFSRHLGITPIL